MTLPPRVSTAFLAATLTWLTSSLTLSSPNSSLPSAKSLTPSRIFRRIAFVSRKSFIVITLELSSRPLSIHSWSRAKLRG